MLSMTIFVLMAPLLLAGEAMAQNAGVGAGRIGSAVDVHGTVESNVQGRAYPLNKGSTVYQNQYVNTREKSVAGLEFLNQSKLHIGPNSVVKLDKSKFDLEKYQSIVALRVKVGSEYRMKVAPGDTTTYKIADPNGALTVRPRG